MNFEGRPHNVSRIKIRRFGDDAIRFDIPRQDSSQEIITSGNLFPSNGTVEVANGNRLAEFDYDTDTYDTESIKAHPGIAKRAIASAFGYVYEGEGEPTKIVDDRRIVT